MFSAAVRVAARPVVTSTVCRSPGVGRAFSILSSLRPGLLTTRRTPISAFTPMSAGPSSGTVVDVVSTDAISTGPMMEMTQVRFGPRNTMNRNSRLIRKRRIGFLARKKSRTGRKILERRLAKGRMRLTN